MVRLCGHKECSLNGSAVHPVCVKAQTTARVVVMESPCDARADRVHSQIVLRREEVR